jgi:hypothetical protein
MGSLGCNCFYVRVSGAGVAAGSRLQPSRASVHLTAFSRLPWPRLMPFNPSPSFASCPGRSGPIAEPEATSSGRGWLQTLRHRLPAPVGDAGRAFGGIDRGTRLARVFDRGNPTQEGDEAIEGGLEGIQGAGNGGRSQLCRPARDRRQVTFICAQNPSPPG